MGAGAGRGSGRWGVGRGGEWGLEEVEERAIGQRKVGEGLWHRGRTRLLTSSTLPHVRVGSCGQDRCVSRTELVTCMGAVRVGKPWQRAREGAKKALNMIIMGKSGEELDGGRVGSGDEKKWGPREDTVLSRTIRGRSGR